MELRQLVYADAVARCGGFGKAAAELRVAQPAISAQVRRLESELGVRLFERTTRRVEITEAGQAFLRRARLALGEVEAARAAAAQAGAVLRGRLRLGATALSGGLDLTEQMARFAGDHPGVRISLRGGLIDKLVGALAAGRLDAVVGPIHRDALPAGVIAHALRSERLVLITGPRCPAVRTLAAVAAEPFVCLGPDSHLHRMLREAARGAGFTPRIAFETHSPASIAELVSAGLGVALIAESAAGQAGAAVLVHRVPSLPRHPPIGVLLRRGADSSAAARTWAQQLVGTIRAR